MPHFKIALLAVLAAPFAAAQTPDSQPAPRVTHPADAQGQEDQTGQREKLDLKVSICPMDGECEPTKVSNATYESNLKR